MATMSNSALMSVTVDFQSVFSQFSNDLVMFVAAMLVWLVLHRVKTKATSAKLAHKEVDVSAYSETSAEEISCIQVATIETSAVEVIEQTHIDEQTKLEHQRAQHFDVDTSLPLMQKYAAEGNIKDTMRVFRKAKQSGANLSSAMYNTVMKAWVKCGNIWEAEDWMDEIKDANKADEQTFIIILKARLLVRDFDKARLVLEDMRKFGVQPSLVIFNELLCACAKEGLVNGGVSLLAEMEAAGVQATSDTLQSIATLISTARSLGKDLANVKNLLAKYGLLPETENQGVLGEPVELPRLASIVSQSDGAAATRCLHDIEIKGSLPRIKAARRTLKQHGFFDKSHDDAWPLDGQWETDHGLTVTIEGKMVRWSRQRASKLQFASEDRKSCTLMVYGESTTGRLVAPIAPCATKALRWDNGDVWHASDLVMVGGTTLFSQSMSKVLRDKAQDTSVRSRAQTALKCVSKQGLCLPPMMEDTLLQYLGSDTYRLTVQFESDSPRMDILSMISCRHPRVGVRHCWVRPSSDSCGQRTLVNGQETDETCFRRHLDSVSRVHAR